MSQVGTADPPVRWAVRRNGADGTYSLEGHGLVLTARVCTTSPGASQIVLEFRVSGSDWERVIVKHPERFGPVGPYNSLQEFEPTATAIILHMMRIVE